MKRELYIATTIITILIGIGLALMPAFSDDILFSFPYRDYLLHGKPFEWRSIWDGWCFIYLHNVTRLSNMVAGVLLAMPRWVAAIFSSLALFYVYIKGLQFAKADTSRYKIAIWLAYIVFCLPWVDQLYLIDFQTNYIWSAALSLYITLAFYHRHDSHPALLFIIAIILGGWHEGFSAPIFASIIAVAWIYKEYRTRSTAIILIGLAIGMVFLATAPSFTLIPSPYFGKRPWMIYPYLFPMLIAGSYAIYAHYRHRLSRQLLIKVLVLMIPSVLSAFLMLYSMQGSRVGTLSIVFSGITLLLLTPQYGKHTITSLLIYALMVAHLLAVDYQAYKAHIGTEKVLADHLAHLGETTYSDMVLREDAPWYCLQKPYYGWFNHSSTMTLFDYFYNPRGYAFDVVPSALKEFSTKKATKIPGDVGAYLFHGLTVVDIDVECHEKRYFVSDYGHGKMLREYTIWPFVCRQDGKRYAWAYPESTWIDHTLSPIPKSFNNP